MKKTLILLAVFFAPLAAFAATSDNFVSLTSLPITGLVNSGDGFAGLVNHLYKICIGLAAAIAVFQIMAAGITYMSAGDSHEKVSQARQRIQSAILGLILVLSPYIVFSIINPDILNLQINGLTQLTSLPAASSTVSTAANGTTYTQVFICTTASAQNNCKNSGGTLSSVCYDASTNTTYPPTAKSCSVGVGSYTCSVQADGCTTAPQVISFGQNASCPQSYANGAVVPSGCESSCNSQQGFKVTPAANGKGSVCTTTNQAAAASACSPLKGGYNSSASAACCNAKAPTCSMQTINNPKSGTYTECYCSSTPS